MHHRRPPSSPVAVVVRSDEVHPAVGLRRMHHRRLYRCLPPLKPPPSAEASPMEPEVCPVAVDLEAAAISRPKIRRRRRDRCC
ncbi:hypothetical protein LINPERPRIM_LOCUS21258 [Linum perenne]